MIKLFRRKRERGDYWLAGEFSRQVHPFADPAMATWSELLGREQARLWLTACANEGRGR